MAKQFGLVGRALLQADGVPAAAQHAQRELTFERVGLGGQGGYVHGLQVGVLKWRRPAWRDLGLWS